MLSNYKNAFVHIKNSGEYILKARHVFSPRFVNHRRHAVTDSSVHPTEQKQSSPTESKDRKPSKPPFIKNMFLGKFDTSVMSFPEILDTEKLQTLENMIDPIQRYFEEKVDSKKIDSDAKIPDETLKGLKELGLFGLQIPEKYGGLNLNATEYTRISELTALDGGIAVTLAAHQSIGLKGIILFGTEAQKQKYLPKLASGEHTAAFCLTEPSSGSDAASITTKATLSDDGKLYLLNGGKIWISNGGTADIFTVFAKTDEEDFEGNMASKVTAFIVERNFGGITNGPPEDKLGIRGSNTCEVHFENTPVPIENVLGEVGKGFKVAMKILNSGRFSMGGAIAGIIKHLLKSTTDHAINREQFQSPLKDFDMIQEKFAKIATTAYVMESMSYLTAGLIDSQDDPDCSVEAAIVKVFSSEGGFYCVHECLQIMGGLGYMKDYPHERYLRDGRIAHIFEGTNEILRLFIVMNSLQHFAKEMSDIVKKLRNPINNFGLAFGKYMEHYRNRKDQPKLNIDIAGHVHPSLITPAQYLEYGVKRLNYAVETATIAHGMGLQNQQMVLRRFADVVIDLYAMTAVLARSSRSYVIGLQNSEHEIRVANLFCNEANKRIKTNIEEILQGPVMSMDMERQHIASLVFKFGGYPYEHPLKKNW